MTDAASGTNPEASTRNTAELMREQRVQRNLKILIAGMGLLILFGLGAVVTRILTGGGSRTPTATASSAVAIPGGEIALELPVGAKIVSVSVSGNRLAVHHESPAGAGIAILDLDTGRRIADVKPRDAVPRN
jgi:hypothetical protein